MVVAPREGAGAAGRAPAGWADWLLLAVIVALFVAIAGHQWKLPGLYNDEAYDVVPAMQLLLGQPVDLNRGVGVHLFGHAFPVMISDYQGVTSMYGVLPLFALFGPGVLAVRAFTIGLGALALILTYLLGRRLVGRGAGLLGALLLAVSPSFIFWSRVGVYVVVQVVPLALGATLAYLRWRRARARGRAGPLADGWLLLAGLLTGLGLSTKILFLWFIAGVAAAGMVIWLVDWRWPLGADGRALPHRPLRARLAEPARVPWRAVAAATLGFLVGAAPLIYYNVASGGTYQVLRANLFHTSKGTSNLAVWDNLAHQAAQFQVLLQGSYFWFLGGVYADHLLLPVFLVSAAGLPALVCGVREYRRYRAAAVFLLTMLTAIYAQSAFTLSGLETTHLLIMLPLPQLVIAAFVALLGRSLARLAGRAATTERTRRALRAAALALPILALVAPPVAADLRVDRQYHQALAATGGKSSFSASIYDLAIFLDRFDYTRPYALDWGMKYNVELLTRGRVQPQEIYGQSTDLPPDFDAMLNRLFADPHAVFLAHRVTGDGVPAAYPGRVEELERLAAAENKNVVVLKVIYESGGAPLFYVYSVRDRR